MNGPPVEFLVRSGDRLDERHQGRGRLGLARRRQRFDLRTEEEQPLNDLMQGHLHQSMIS